MLYMVTFTINIPPMIMAHPSSLAPHADRRNIGPRTTAVLGHRDGHSPYEDLVGHEATKVPGGQNVTHGIPLPSDFKQKKPCNFGVSAWEMLARAQIYQVYLCKLHVPNDIGNP